MLEERAGDAAVDAAPADAAAAAAAVVAVVDAPVEAVAAAAPTPFQVVWDLLADPHPHLQAVHEANVLHRERINARGPFYYDSSDSDDDTNVVDPGQFPIDPGEAASLFVNVVHWCTGTVGTASVRSW